MGVEKEGSKSGGGYVGGFFQLFDWTAKSRKKLFSSKSDLPERYKQGKRSDGSFPMTRLHLMDEDETGAGSSIRGGDYSCSSSITDDDGYGARAPGVVAKLMGLDSLPTSSFQEPNSTPFFDTQSLLDASHSRKQINYYHDRQIMYSGNLLNNEDDPPRKFSEPKPAKVLSRPIEKFQTEILPPKSAKSIPITHHKLLSPIKSPSFIPSKTAAHIMEAAARMIEPGPHATPKAKMPLVGSSSVPLKVQVLKEKLEVAQKMPLAGSTSTALKARGAKEKLEATHKTSRLAEASRRPVESNAAKYLKGQSLNKSWNGSADTSFRASSGTEESPGVRTKEKSISLAIQAKVNVQRREGMHSGSSRSLVCGQKQQAEALSSQPNIRKSLQKRSSMHNSSGVLRQNNQKQNCPMDRDKLPSKSSVTNLQGKRVLASSPGQHKSSAKTVSSKTGSRKSSLEVTENGKANSNNSQKIIPRKRSIDGSLHLGKSQDNILIENNQKAFESTAVFDRHFGWAEEGKKKGMDVVSFTFTAPLTRSMPGSETSGQVQQKNIVSCMDNRGKRLLLDSDCMKLSSAGYNPIGGDALSTLLEQKLRELTKSVELSCASCLKEGSASSSASIVQNLVPTVNATTNKARLHHNKDQHMAFIDELGGSFESDLLSSTDPERVRSKHIFQGVDKAELSCRSNGTRKQYDYRRPSPVSVLEPCFSTESCSSLDSSNSNSTEASKQSSSIQALEVFAVSSNKFHYVDADMDLSDSASSTSSRNIIRNYASNFSVTDHVTSEMWEIKYVKKIVSNLDLMFHEFALGRASEMINPHLFNMLERHKDGLQGDGAEARLERKLLFDCVVESLDVRCRHYVGGGYETWVKGMTMVKRKERLAEEIHKDITVWGGMGDCIVDELVDKDMSRQYGRWLDFEVDAFVLGAEVEDQIFNSLVEEVLGDILQF